MYCIWQIMIYKSKIWTHPTGKAIFRCHSLQTTTYLIYTSNKPLWYTQHDCHKLSTNISRLVLKGNCQNTLTQNI